MPLLTSAFATVDIAMAIVTGLVVVSSIPSLISKVTMDIEGGGGLLTMCCPSRHYVLSQFAKIMPIAKYLCTALRAVPK